MSWKTEDTLWKIVQRYDTYFNSTNAKAAFLIAYLTFCVGVILVQVGNVDVIASKATAPTVRIIFLGVTTLTTLVTLIALARVLLVVVPYLASNKKAGTYHSIVYYADVAEHKDADAYLAHVKQFNEEKIIEDLTRQVHVLAQGLEKKFQSLKGAIMLTVWLQIPLFAILLGVVLIQKLNG